MKNIEQKHIPQGKKIYFASDFHLGVPDMKSSRKREQLLVQWLEKIRKDAFEIYLMGDIFDFWFEYKTVIPKGYTRLFGKLAELSDLGIPIHIFKGNHDIWAFDYFTEELNIQMHRDPKEIIYNDTHFFLCHGDGLGPGDHGYKILKSVFEFPLNQWLFNWLHPDIGTRLGLYFSRRSRISNMAKEQKRAGNEPLEDIYTYKYSKSLIEKGSSVNYFIYGHSHQAINEKLSSRSRFVILGDWITLFTYAEFDGEDLQLLTFER